MAFKMRGFNPGKGTGMGESFMKKTAPYKAKGGADPTKHGIEGTVAKKTNPLLDMAKRAKKVIEAKLEGKKRVEDKAKEKMADSKKYSKALANDAQLEKYIAKRKTLEKGSAAFGNNQHRINTAYYGKEKADSILANYRKKNKLTDPIASVTEKQTKVDQKAIDKKAKVDTKVKEGKVTEAKGKIKKGEIDENLTQRQARIEKKGTRKGKGDKRQKAVADLSLEKAKLRDLEGAQGGKKGKVFGKLRTKLAKKRVAKREQQLKDSPNKYTATADTKKKTTSKKEGDKKHTDQSHIRRSRAQSTVDRMNKRFAFEKSQKEG